jgi:hypothetical protein
MGDGKKVLMTKVELMHDDYSEHLLETIEMTDECVLKITKQIDDLTSIRDKMKEIKIKLQLEYPE